ncbi:MAG TPA: helix-turn-helix transcriptional regulator [Actinomycetota bacterium]|jgi:molybdopterin-binding protein
MPPAKSEVRLIRASEAARALGISLDTLRRWDREGRIEVVRNSSNQRMVPESEVTRLQGRGPGVRTGVALSARNRITGVIRSVEVSGVVAMVEMECGPYRIASLITRDAVEELGLAPGVRAVATVKATSVMVSRE